jgi:hypothetical protein
MDPSKNIKVIKLKRKKRVLTDIVPESSFSGNSASPSIKTSSTTPTQTTTTSTYLTFMERDVQIEGYEKGKQKSKEIFQINSGRRPRLMERIEIGRNEKISLKVFYDCLDIYNNNQIVLKSLRMSKINVRDIIILENWFCDIQEPFDGDLHWNTRERMRLDNGISYYCDSDIRKIILKERHDSFC